MLPNEKSATDLCGPDADTSDLHLQPVACLHQGVCKHSTTSIQVWCLQTQCYFNTVRVSANTVQLHYSQCLQTQCNFTTVRVSANTVHLQYSECVCKHSATSIQPCVCKQCKFNTIRVSANTVQVQYNFYNHSICQHAAPSIRPGCLPAQCNFSTIWVSANTMQLQYSQRVCKHSKTFNTIWASTSTVQFQYSQWFLQTLCDFNKGGRGAGWWWQFPFVDMGPDECKRACSHTSTSKASALTFFQ